VSSPPNPALPKCRRLKVVAGWGGNPELLPELLIVRESDADAVAPFASVTPNEAICVPAAVGVPLIVPLVLIESPLGRPLADHMYGVLPPVAARVAE
jgi:hypothetical protein